MNEIKIKAPATIANLSCGYDVLGLCLNSPYDEIKVIKTKDKEIKIKILDSEFSNIPSAVNENTGGIPAVLIQKKLKLNFGFNIEIKKGIPLSGGLGSSAATAAGVVYGINKLLGGILSVKDMVSYALEGEKLSTDTPHADNIVPCLVGGLVIIKSTYPLEYYRMPIGDFHFAILHPKIIVNTKEARKILPHKVALSDAVKQWGNIAALTYGFTVNDVDIIRSSMNDFIIEPVRSNLINGFDQFKNTALEMGAIGSSISGSGPSIFALCSDKDSANTVLKSMEDKSKEINQDYHSYVSSINFNGPQTIK